MAVDELHYDGHDLEALFELRNYQRWIAGLFGPYLGQEAVEFGAGIGAMSQWIVPQVENIELVEPSENLVARLHERFAGNQGVSIVSRSLEEYVADRPDESLDAALLVNLLEHIEDDVGALCEIRRTLRPDGHLLIFVPAMQSLYSEMDRILGHHRRYSLRGLRSVVESAGYEIVKLRYFDLLGILPWWLVNTVGGATQFDPKLSGLYDKVCVPVTRAVEAVIPPPLGKNLLLVARPASGGAAR